MNPLDQIMGVIEAGERWSLHPDSVKRLCVQKKVIAKKIGKTWVLLKDQPNPSVKEKP
jgi:hypothetical protein